MKMFKISNVILKEIENMLKKEYVDKLSTLFIHKPIQAFMPQFNCYTPVSSGHTYVEIVNVDATRTFNANSIKLFDMSNPNHTFPH